MQIALNRLTRVSRISPVDLAQARHRSRHGGFLALQQGDTRQRVNPVTVKEALIEINNAIAAYHQEETGRTRFR